MNAKRDKNLIPTMTGVLDSDGETVTNATADPVTNLLDVEDDTTGSDNGNDLAVHDSNMVPTLIAVSDVDGKSIVPLYVDSSGCLLINSA